MNTRILPVRLYVGAVALLATAAVYLSWRYELESGLQSPDLVGAAVLVLAGLLLEGSSIKLRGGDADGSIAFVVHISAGVLFGAFWAVPIVVLSTLLGQITKRNPPIKVLFNVCQHVLSMLAAFSVYRLLGGEVQPGYLLPGGIRDSAYVLTQLGALLVGVLGYIGVNSIAVSGVVGLSSGRSPISVWKTNTLWVIAYDLVATFPALLVCYLYLRFNTGNPWDRIWFLAVIAGLAFVRHIYVKLNLVQSLSDERNRALEQLEQNVRDVLALMVKSIEARDPYTSGHSRRVGAMSKAIAVEFGLPPEEVDRIENAALLHDIGKIHAEFAPLLAKDGRLTPEEWEIMKTHSVRSQELVALFAPFRGEVEKIVRHHHERWDGKGYPDGVAGENIPMGSRVIMIADTIDAMTTDRPYRKALGFDVVVAELQKYRGIQFDPVLVEATIRSMTVRRFISEPEFREEQSTGIGSKVFAKGPLRSTNSFWEGAQVTAQPGSPG